MANGIKVNDKDWNNLSAEVQTSINNMMAINFGETVTPDASAPSAGGAGALSASGAAGGLQAQGVWCKLGCQMARVAATAGCAALPPPANAVCMVAAQAGYDFCMSKC